MLDGRAQIKLLGQKADRPGNTLLELSAPQLSVRMARFAGKK